MYIDGQCCDYNSHYINVNSFSVELVAVLNRPDNSEPSFNSQDRYQKDRTVSEKKLQPAELNCFQQIMDFFPHRCVFQVLLQGQLPLSLSSLQKYCNKITLRNT